MAQLVDNIQSYNDWGDYLHGDDEDNILGVAEGFEAYDVRVGYHGRSCYPVTIGELIQGGGKSYRIEHKLGHGTFSTVWLAFEVETNTPVALKIHRNVTTAGQAESQIHRDIQQTIPDPNGCHLLTSTSIFSLPGQYSDHCHMVMVLPITGPNVDTYMYGWGQLEASSTRLRLAKDVLEAVACLNKHGFIHRDLNDRNVMLGLAPGVLDEGPTPLERYKQVGRPQKVSLPSGELVWRTGDIVAPIEWPLHLIGKTAFLGDFGLTKLAGSAVTDNWRPPQSCCPPESFHEEFEPNYESDMWGFMCVFTTLITALSPFSGWSASGTLGCITRMLGPLPEEWEGRYKWPQHYSQEERCKWYDQSRTPEDSLEEFLDRCRKDLVGTRERELVLEVMHKGFQYQPSERLTAQRLLDDTSFLELMSIHGIA